MNTGNNLWILGISASPHNGAACLLKGDEIVVALQEERLNRIKRAPVLGACYSMAIERCLDYAGIRPRDLSLVVCCVTNQSRIPEQDLSLNPVLETKLNKIPTLYIPHHLGHAVSAFATSGFTESAVLIIDGIGSPYEDFNEDEKAACKWMVEDGWETISLYYASGTSLKPLEKQLVGNFGWISGDKNGMQTFGSLGGMYSAVAAQIFGDAYDGAGKMMGLAPYGKPKIPAKDFFDIKEGRFIFHDHVPKRFRSTDRWPLHQEEYADLAASTQSALEEAILHLVDRLHKLCPSDNLSYAGGVALNSVANERIVRESKFKNVYITPPAEDSGTAIGAAYYGLWRLIKRNTFRKLLQDAVGPVYSDPQIFQAVEDTPAVTVESCDDILARTVDLLCEGKIIGWFDGRSELGPRALGQRSILCDPRRPDAKEVLNNRVKHRESFRPFAPIVLGEEVMEWFHLDGACPESPFMLRVCSFQAGKREEIPAVVHVDGTGRFQTVTREANGRLYRLLKMFYEKTGVPILLNTSFNVAGEPIVESPRDALKTFLSTGIDYCVLADKLACKRKQILFEHNEVPWPQRILLQQSEALKVAELAIENAGERPLSPLPEDRPLVQYVGIFESETWGRIKIEREGHQLIIRLDGHFVSQLYGKQSLRLDRYHQDIFEIRDGRFAGIRVVFLPDRRNRVNLLVILRNRAASTFEVFFRACNTSYSGATIGDSYEQIVGEYHGEARLINVSLRNGSLVVSVPGQPAFELLPVKETEFVLKDLPGFAVQFNANRYGVIASATVTQPSEVVTLEKKLSLPSRS